ncbi:MAG: NAD(P)H-hydrate epimerase [Candidatus Dormibacteria bacterium]
MLEMTSWRLGLTPDQMREVDRLAAEEFAIAQIQLMEMAGLATARVARELLEPPLAERAIVILAGPGNNGGDALVAARRLSGWGASVAVITSFPFASARGPAVTGLRALQAAGVPVRAWNGQLPDVDLLIDGLLGFGATGSPRGTILEMITASSEPGRRILAIDLPSGMDGVSGKADRACLSASATVTMAAPKTGLLAEAAAPYVGRLFLADIGIPPQLLRRMGVDPSGLFEASDLYLLR